MLAALTSGDEQAVKAVLERSGTDVYDACGQAYAYASDNGAKVVDCGVAGGSAPGFTVKVTSLSSVGKSVVKGSETVYSTALATAVIEPRCAVDGIEGALVKLTCDHDDLTVDPTAGGFALDLSTFYRIHLSK